jgi:phosphohistidine phosphatase
MKSLTIVRHAKAERPEGYSTDFDRPLTERGERDAVRMAALLGRLAPPVDWWLSSPALRTRQTTERMAAECGYDGTVQWEAAIYEASDEAVLDLLATIPQEVEHAVVVGHNPGMADLVSGLVGGAPSRLNLHMPTAALVHVELEIFLWNQIRWGAGRLALLVTPKSLKK